MTSFRFPLQKVLDWRLTQLNLEEVRYKHQAAALAELDRARAEIEAAGVKAKIQVRDWGQLQGRDLAALGSFRQHVKLQEKQIHARRLDCARILAERQNAMLEARRRCRLLERLKERRLVEWKAACDHEMEELASESYLAQWKRPV